MATGVGEQPKQRRPSNRDWSDCDPTFAEEANAAIGALRGPGPDADAHGLAARLVERYPDSPLAHTILAEWHRVRGRLEGERSSLERAAALAPGCPRTAFMLAAVLTRMGLCDEAMEVCDRILRVTDPTDPARHLPYPRNRIVSKNAEHRIAYTREGIRRLRLGAEKGRRTAVPPESALPAPDWPPESAEAELQEARDLWRGMSEEERQAFLKVSFEDMKSYCRSGGELEKIHLLSDAEQFVKFYASSSCWTCPLCRFNIIFDEKRFMIHMENFHIEHEEYKKLRSSLPKRVPDNEMELLKSWRWEPMPIDGDDLAERTEILSKLQKIVSQLIDKEAISLCLLYIMYKFIMRRVRPVTPLVVSMCACCGIRQLSSAHLKELYEFLQKLTPILTDYVHQKAQNGEQESQQDSLAVTTWLKETGTLSFDYGKIVSRKTDGSSNPDEIVDGLFHESLLEDPLVSSGGMWQRCLGLGPDILNKISEALNKLKVNCSSCEKLQQKHGDVYFLPDAIFETDIDVKPYFDDGIGSVQVEMLLIDVEMDYQKKRLLETCKVDYLPVILPIAKACLRAKLNNLRPLNVLELQAPLDVILRSLWHIRRFRNTVQNIPCKCPEVKDGDSQIGKKLHEIFDSWDNEKAWKPCDPCDSTRFADFTTSLVYTKDGKRKTATDIVKLIFRRLHSSQTPLHFEFKGENLEHQTPIKPSLLGCICLVHDLFGLHIYENKFNCVNEVHTKYKYTTFLHSIDLGAIGKTKVESFRELLKAWKSRIESCGDMVSQYSLLYPPRLFMTGRVVFSTDILNVIMHICFLYLSEKAFGWKDDKVSHINMHEVLMSLAAELDISHFYGGLHSGSKYTLVSAVCWNGQGQYVCFARNENRWLIYDNNKVMPAGSWQESIERYRQYKLRPEILFFEHVE
uniref:USP domain-containing protein n=1 Tax=Oryza punctata TaxID=4537 RepID=A0A0E0MG64_ORYPU